MNDNDKKLAGKRAVVTGVGRGIGVVHRDNACWWSDRTDVFASPPTFVNELFRQYDIKEGVTHQPQPYWQDQTGSGAMQLGLNQANSNKETI